MERKQIVVIGGGPAGLMAADRLSLTHNVILYEKEKNIGQKFLVAGKGGFNITNAAQGVELARKYSPLGFMDAALSDFGSLAFRDWLSAMGIATYVGTSGRVFPEKGIKPVDVLNKIRSKLVLQGVHIFTQHEFVGFDVDKHVVCKHQGQRVVAKVDCLIFALGGASWPVTGSDGTWQTIFASMGVKTVPFQSSNCGLNISWPEPIRQNHAGKPLKNIKLFTAEAEVKGEAVITEYGLEGNAVYPLVPPIRQSLNAREHVFLNIDFKPSNTEAQLLQKVLEKDIKSKDYGKIFNMSSAQLAVVKAYSNKEDYLMVTGFIRSIKKLAIPVQSLRPLAEAISTIGGIDLAEVNSDFSLKKYPWIFTVGEMLDWDAPTGGFLLQGCFSMGNFVAKTILGKE